MTADAEFLLDGRFAVAVLFHFSGAGAAAHADVLDGSAEPGHFVSLEMIQGDENIGVHDGASDFCLFDVFSVRDGDRDIIGSLETVADDDVASGRVGRETVAVGCFDMFQRMFAGTDVKGVAVGQERMASEFFHFFRNDPGEVRADE